MSQGLTLCARVLYMSLPFRPYPRFLHLATHFSKISSSFSVKKFLLLGGAPSSFKS